MKRPGLWLLRPYRRARLGEDIVCLVMVERCEANFAGIEGRRRWDLRMTQIHRRIENTWHVVHRHAEPLVDTRDLAATLGLLARRTS